MEAYTDYFVDVNNENGFVRQLEVFQTYEEAVKFTADYNEPLSKNEYLNIIFVDYNENGNEIAFGSVV